MSSFLLCGCRRLNRELFLTGAVSDLCSEAPPTLEWSSVGAMGLESWTSVDSVPRSEENNEVELAGCSLDSVSAFPSVSTKGLVLRTSLVSDKGKSSSSSSLFPNISANS